MDNALKKHFYYYLAACLFFSATLATGIVLKKYGDSLSGLTAKLRLVRTNLDAMRTAASEIDKTISETKNAMPSGLGSKSREANIYVSLDELKSRIKEAEISAADLGFKDEEITLPVGIKAALRDYTGLVNNIGYLQALRFPFFTISSVTLSEGSDKTVSYEINGVFRMPKIAKATK